jgi:hypothetical protein
LTDKTTKKQPDRAKGLKDRIGNGTAFPKSSLLGNGGLGVGRDGRIRNGAAQEVKGLLERAVVLFLGRHVGAPELHALESPDLRLVLLYLLADRAAFGPAAATETRRCLLGAIRVGSKHLVAMWDTSRVAHLRHLRGVAGPRSQPQRVAPETGSLSVVARAVRRPREPARFASWLSICRRVGPWQPARLTTSQRGCSRPSTT